ncbi:MAG TPA: MFS transporter [Chloroflexota bacterium]|nr:MFS transporter [Chloroflexota bacterium]
MTSTAPRRALVPADSIFHNRDFMLLWIAQFITQTAQQAIWFGMIIVVEDISQSSVQLSVAMLSTIIPGVLLGLIAGVVVDRSNKKRVLVVTNAMRAGVVLGYLFYTRSLYIVYLVNFLFVGVSQFFGPAEASSIPALVPKRQLISANSLFNLTFTVSQLVGIVLLAPWVIKFFGAGTLFIAVAVVYVIASGITSFLPSGVKPERSLTTLRGHMVLRVARTELAEAWTFIRSDRRTWWSMIFATLASTLILILAMLAPRYVVVEAGIRPEDSVFLFAPAGVGIFLMTLVMNRLARRFGELRLAYAGGIIFGLGLVAMALLPSVWNDLGPLAAHLRPGQPVPPRFGLIPPLVAISATLGVGFALATIPSQSVLMDRAPVQSRGRIFSVLLILGNVAAITPLAFLGALADLFGVATIVGVVGLLTLLLTTVGIRERPDRQLLVAPTDEPPVHLP